MMAFPGMLVDAALKAGMKTPADPDAGYDRDAYPHFDVFCKVQLCRPVQWGEHWENAKIVAAFSEEEIKQVSITDLLMRGLHFTQ